MTDFTLEPDDLESPDRPDRHRPPRMVSTGIHPTAAVPTPRRQAKDVPPCYAPCLLCGAMVLTGETLHGHPLHLEVQVPCYAVTWANAATVPTLLPSRAYPVHRCGELEAGHFLSKCADMSDSTARAEKWLAEFVQKANVPRKEAEDDTQDPARDTDGPSAAPRLLGKTCQGRSV